MQAGQQEVMVKQLPGFPDGITTDSNGNFWVGLVVPKMPIIDWIENRHAPHQHQTRPCLASYDRDIDILKTSPEQSAEQVQLSM